MPSLPKFWKTILAYLSALDEGHNKDEARSSAIAAYEAQQPAAGPRNRQKSEEEVGAIVNSMALEPEALDAKQSLRFAKVRAIAAGADYDLWKYFQDRADQIKERLWTTATWLISVQAAFLTILFSAEILQFTMASKIQFSICLPIPAFFLSLFGIGLSFYSLAVLSDADAHITKNWERANQISQEFTHVDPYRKQLGFKIPWYACWLLVVVFSTISLMSALQLICEWRNICLWSYSFLGSCPAPNASG